MADRVAHVDATSGVAGDMLLGALLDAGADLGSVRGAVGSLGIGASVHLERARRGGLACARLRAEIPDDGVGERHLADVLDLVAAADLAPAARRFAERAFEALARAEGAVHDLPPAQVHFHEVGALDALVDVVGTAAAAGSLGLLDATARTTCSALAAGSGTVRSAHGMLPVPAPAVLRLAADAGLCLTGGELAGERTTPTGAALVATLAVPGPLPELRVESVGVGGGGRDPDDRPNVTRVVVGRAAEAAGRLRDEVLVVAATVDDLDPRLWPSVLAAVRAAGAWDCATTGTTGRGGRPGRVLEVLCAPEVREAVVDAVFRHTSTLGVRWSRWERATARRRSVAVEVGPEGARQVVTVKVDASGPSDVPALATPELAEAEAAATALGWPVRAVVEAALVAYRSTVTP